MSTPCPQCGVKVKNVARHIAQRRDHDSNYGTTAEPVRAHDYTDLDVERMDIDFDGTWEHEPDQLNRPTSPSAAREDPQLQHPGEPNEDYDPVDTEFVGAGYSLLISTSNR